MEGTDLKPKTKPLFIKVTIYVFIFLLTFFFILFLYTYLWDTLKKSVVRSFSKDFYVERTEWNCRDIFDCRGACDLREPNDACLCLEGSCYLVDNAHQFAENKFCESDFDCVASCYEGAISRTYYESRNGSRNDCTEGCMRLTATEDGQDNRPVCINRQCQFRDGQTCYIGPLPQPD